MNFRIVSILFTAIAAVACGPGNGPLIYGNDAYTWYADSVRQGDWLAYAESPASIVSEYPAADGTPRSWRQKNDISAYGTYTGVTTFETALCNMAVDELVNNIEADSTLRTGALWAGVWTRDVSYSMLLSLAETVPDISRITLMHKVDRLGRIVQDTGTGGSWPCSSDRVVWALAAWKVYVVTGDEAWLAEIYPIVRRSLEDDFRTTYDQATGLFCGESSFIDWREQSYPRWMQPADIFRSECLGTNAVYYGVLQAMGRMAGLLGFDEQSGEYARRAEALKNAINKHFWMDEKGYYAQFLYGRNHLLLSPRSETLGESLAILSGIASEKQARRIAASMPVSAFGPTIFWPQIGSEPNYHNNAVWPFVAAFWGRAAAKAGNEQAVLHALAGNVRAAAIFATNQENFTASTGDPDTQLNSPNMLWSLAGFIGTVRHTLLGIQPDEQGIAFAPFVPQALGGERQLTGFRYRSMTLDITVRGSGHTIRSFTLDGEPAEPYIPASLTGRHTVCIELDGRHGGTPDLNLRPYTASPEVPTVTLTEGLLEWERVLNAAVYLVFRDGVQVVRTTECRYPADVPGEYQVVAVDAIGTESFACEPVRCYTDEVCRPAAARLDRRPGRQFAASVTVPADGLYAIDWRYANGNGGITDRNMCATRSLFVDDTYCGPSVFPQRADNDWTQFGWSNALPVRLTRGTHSIELRFLPHNENMNIDTNTAVTDTLRITRIG